MTGAPTAVRNDEGFTLIELLVAMTLLALLSVGVYSGLRLGVKAWERNTAHTKGTNEIARAQGVLRQLIGDAYPLFVADVADPHIAFEGQPDRVTLLAPAQAILGTAGNAQVTIAARMQDGQLSLVLLARHELADKPANTVRQELLDNIKSLKFAYYGSTVFQRPAEWHDSWSGQSRPPAFVRVRAELKDGDVRRWPDLVIAPVISADAGCIYDPLTKYCQGR